MQTAWNNRSATDYVHILATRFGQPSAVDPTPGGLAIWKLDKLQNTCIDRIEIRDEAVPHCVPGNHLDFVYAFVNYDVNQSKYMEVVGLSDTIGYDHTKKQLWARCGTIDAVIATLALATQVGEGAISLNYAKSNDLVHHYLVASQDPNQSERLYALLCYNLKHQSGNPTKPNPTMVPACYPATL